MKLIAKDATDAKTLAISHSRRPECNGRRPGPGFGQRSGRTSFELFQLAWDRLLIGKKQVFALSFDTFQKNAVFIFEYF